MQALINAYRKRHGFEGRGVVIVYEGLLQGWCETLPDPHEWLPGCIAIDTHYRQWLAADGNARDGADSWQPLQDTLQP